jgi:hypothetical protein
MVDQALTRGPELVEGAAVLRSSSSLRPAPSPAGFGGFSSTTRHFPSMRSTSPRSASLPRRMLTVLVLEPTRRASSATPAFGAARIASSKRPSEALTSSGVGRFHSPMSFRRDEREGVRAAGNAGGRGSSPFGVARGATTSRMGAGNAMMAVRASR